MYSGPHATIFVGSQDPAFPAVRMHGKQNVSKTSKLNKWRNPLGILVLQMKWEWPRRFGCGRVLQHQMVLRSCICVRTFSKGGAQKTTGRARKGGGDTKGAWGTAEKRCCD